jgi:HEAT repeat protein
LGDSQANDALISALNDEDNLVRSNAALALGMIGDSNAIDPLIEVLEDDGDSKVRSSSAEAIGQIGDPRAADALIKSVKDDESDSVRSSAAEALKKILKNH